MQRLKLSTTQVNTKKTCKQEEKEIATIKENPKFFYKYAANYSKTKSNVGPLISE